MDFNVNSGDHVVERQFMLDRSYNGPLVDFLRANVKPGDRVAFFRNVKGMMAFFYVPEMHWVGLLDSGSPRNQSFRGVLPDDQFDDYAGVDWYVVWDPRGAQPKGLSKDYKQVWQYDYAYRQSWWDWNEPQPTRSYRVYRRPAAGPSGTPAPSSR
jgi:hypothetical protein